MKEIEDSTQSRLRSEETAKCSLEERLDKCHDEIHTLRKDHLALSEFLHRLARALNYSDSSSPPPLGAETNIMAENLLEQVERLATHYELHKHAHDHLHGHSPKKVCRIVVEKVSSLNFSWFHVGLR